MLNFVCLSPYFPNNFSLFWTRLNEAGVKVLGIGEQPYDQLSEELKKSLSEYYWIEDMHHFSSLEQACQHFIDKHGPIHRLESHNEYWLETEAKLRSKFNIPGPKDQGISQIKSKSDMKQTYKDAGIPVAQGQKVYHWDDSQNLIKKTGYPIVAKPDIGVGAAHTYKIHNEEELRHFWKSKPNVDYFMEEFVKGELYSFDGLVDDTGKLLIHVSHHFKQGIMETVNQDLDLSYYSLKNIPNDLYEAGKKVLKAFGITSRFFHFEFFRLPDQRLVALEVNVRPPGGLTTDMINFANDIDLYKGYAQMITGQKFTEHTHHPFYSAYAGRKHNKTYLYSHDELLIKLGSAVVFHDQMSEVFHPVIGHYGYLIKATNLDELHQHIAWVHALKN